MEPQTIEAPALAFAQRVVPELTKAAAVTGTQLTELAIAAMLEDLADFPVEKVIDAVRRARREVRQLTLPAIIERIEALDAHPGADAAWAMCPMREEDTAFLTEPMRLAFAVAFPLLQRDRVAARMAFKDAYERIVADHRLRRVPVTWWPTLGTDPDLRQRAIAEAVAVGRIGIHQAAKLGYVNSEALPALPSPGQTDELQVRLASLMQQLTRRP